MPIKVENVHYTYQKETVFAQKALTDVSLNLENGDILGVAGTTGSGKSTLLQMLNAILLPDSGRVLVDNIDTAGIKGKKVAQLRQKVGLVMQFPEQQMFEPTVGRDVAYGPQNLGLNSSEVHERVQWALNTVGLPYDAFKNRSPLQLSSGEKRRAAIAGVLALNPNYLVLDEPTAGLDNRGRDRLLKNLYCLNRNNNITMVIVSHQFSDLLAICSHLLVLADGKAYLQGDIWSVLDNSQQLIEQGFKLPASLEVVQGLKRRGWNISTQIRNVRDAGREIGKALRN